MALDTNRHKNILIKILKDIYTDNTIGPILGFKGAPNSGCHSSSGFGLTSRPRGVMLSQSGFGWVILSRLIYNRKVCPNQLTVGLQKKNKLGPKVSQKIRLFFRKSKHWLAQQ